MLPINSFNLGSKIGSQVKQKPGDQGCHGIEFPGKKQPKESCVRTIDLSQIVTSILLKISKL